MNKALMNGKGEMLSVQLVLSPHFFFEDEIESDGLQQKNSPHKLFSSKTSLTQNTIFTS